MSERAATPPAGPVPTAEGVPPTRRLVAALASWILLLVATPGALSRDGSVLIAAFALVPWAFVCSRPGPKAVRVEWLAGLAMGGNLYWVHLVWTPLVAWVAIGMGAYMALAGGLLRRFARRLPLALATGLAWTGAEAVRSVIPPPFGLGWQLLGHHAHATPALAGSARVWGVLGLSFALAAFAGGVAELLSARGFRPRALLGAAPLALAALLAALVPAPETEDGPRVLLVQPAFEQARKQNPGSPSELFEESCDLTRRGLAELAARGEPPPDLVVWGETMLMAPLAGEGLEAGVRAGAQRSPWHGRPLTLAGVRELERGEAYCVGEVLFGHILAPGTSFVSGALMWVAAGERVLPANTLVLWTDGGARRSNGGKVHLVPGAEMAMGLERFAWMREVAYDIAGYVPDMYPWPRTEVLDLPARVGPDGEVGPDDVAETGGEAAAGGTPRTWHFGATVCFDNAFPAEYTEPLRRAPLDFHLVASNEAWYLESFEMDQMVAFSRMIAIETGRSVVRAGNAGVTLVIDPAGREVARLEVDGRDRLVPGTLAATVPVPRGGSEGAPVPLYVRTDRAWTALFLLLAALAWWRAGRFTDGAAQGAAGGAPPSREGSRPDPR